MITNTTSCRFCRSALINSFADLGSAPLCNKNIPLSKAHEAELYFPLHAKVCSSCRLVQLDESVNPDEIFGNGEYTYFSSFSDTCVEHARQYCSKITTMLELNEDSFVIEIASNDGYLLQNFVDTGIPCLGVEPAANCATAAIERGVENWVDFFSLETAKQIVCERGKANLLLGNNVLAHVPDINDFVAGVKEALAQDGVATFEFPHLEQMVKDNLFDTIYHEHYSYFSFTVINTIFAKYDLRLFNVELLPIHGGSLRIYCCHSECESYPLTNQVRERLRHEEKIGIFTDQYYADFNENVRETKRRLLEFLIEKKREGKTIVAYGAPGKGNTLLNYCGIRQDFIDYTVDRSPHKQNTLLPGSRIPVFAPERIFETKPDYVLILPWNLRDEIMKQMGNIQSWGGKFVVPLPSIQVLD